MQNYVLGKARDRNALWAMPGHRVVNLRWMKGALKVLPRGAWLSHVLSGNLCLPRLHTEYPET